VQGVRARAAVEPTLARGAWSRTDANGMPALMRAARARAAEGESVELLRAVWGSTETARVWMPLADIGRAASTDVKTMGVVGAGFMGSGIAEAAARSDISVVVYEPTTEPLERSAAGIRAAVATAVKRGKLAAEEGEADVARIQLTTQIEVLARADLVVEPITGGATVKLETPWTAS
jgi:NADPH-dependent 2,4-dienoyl-CoA reductase/sulfur reductase-like enzyme